MPYTLAIHKGESRNPEDNNPHAHLVISERINDGQERSAETWFKRGEQEGAGEGRGAEIEGAPGAATGWSRPGRSGRRPPTGRWIGQAERNGSTPAAWPSGLSRPSGSPKLPRKTPPRARPSGNRLLERAAELSREPDVKLPPALAVQAAAEAVVGKEQIHSENPLIRRAAEVEQRNAAQIEERDGPIQRIKTRIGEIQQQLKHLPDHIMAAAERAAEWSRAQRRTWLKKHGYESEVDYKHAMLAEKYSHANGPQISERPSAKARAENERQQSQDRGRSR